VLCWPANSLSLAAVPPTATHAFPLTRYHPSLSHRLTLKISHLRFSLQI
jgi:hypothetical protein